MDQKEAADYICTYPGAVIQGLRSFKSYCACPQGYYFRWDKKKQRWVIAQLIPMGLYKPLDLHANPLDATGTYGRPVAAQAKAAVEAELDLVNHPPHYTSHPSGVECIQITRHMGFNIGNAIKYLWRADEKGNAIEDLKKAAWYIEDELRKRGG
jgi:hypothetical protein